MNALTMQAKALAHAQRIAKACDSLTRLVVDTEMGDRCYIVVDKPTYAIVVYLDEPDTQCSVRNRDGRFVNV